METSYKGEENKTTTTIRPYSPTAHPNLTGYSFKLKLLSVIYINKWPNMFALSIFSLKKIFFRAFVVCRR